MAITYSELYDRIAELERENVRLKEELQKTHETAFVYSVENKGLKEQREELWEENDRLRAELTQVKGEGA